MLWALGAAESTLFDPVADTGVFGPIFPWFGVLAEDGSLTFPMLDGDSTFTTHARTPTR